MRVSHWNTRTRLSWPSAFSASSMPQARDTNFSASSRSIEPLVSIATAKSRTCGESQYSSGSISGMFPYTCSPYV